MNEVVEATRHVDEEPLEACSFDQVVERVRNGRVDPTQITVEVRQRCVGHLSEQGHSAAEIAAMLRIGERTVKRDRAALRSEGAVLPTLELSDELLGEYERVTQHSLMHLRKIAREEKSSEFARIYALEAAARVYRQFIDTARRMGYLSDARLRIMHLESVDPEHVQRLRDIDRASFARIMAHPAPPEVHNDPQILMMGKMKEELEAIQRKRREA